MLLQSTIQRKYRHIVSPTELGRALGVSRQRANQLMHPEKRWAREAVYRAMKSGLITRPAACSRCHDPDKGLQAHHDDYAKRLSVRWLCIECHTIIHPHGFRRAASRFAS